MSDYFIYAGVDTRVLGVEVFEGDTFGAPSRIYSPLDVPGKSGSLLLDEKRYPDIEHSYNVVIYQNFESTLSNLRNALVSKVGYQRLEDSIHPDEFYRAYYSTDFVTMMKPTRRMGHCTVTFTRKPQRYLKSGETAVTLSSDGSITNPTLFDSQPLLRIYGTGVVGIGDNAITITTADVYTDIDCETMEAYKGSTSCNAYVQIQNNDFPVLHPGANGITLGTGITQVQVTPRWFRL